MERLLKSQAYGDRRGAAYGLAGLVKGIGIPILKNYGIMNKLQSAVENKKHVTSREGALFAVNFYSSLFAFLYR